MQRLLQRLFQLSKRHKPLELRPDDSCPINDKNPRLRYQAPLFHRRKHLFAGEVLPDFLVDESDSAVIFGKQLPNDIDHRSAHPACAELRGREDDELGLSLGDGVRDPDPVQPRIRLVTGIDLPQISHI